MPERGSEILRTNKALQQIIFFLRKVPKKVPVIQGSPKLYFPQWTSCTKGTKSSPTSTATVPNIK